MKSRITIEVDFDNGNQPVIQILQRDSEDVRDRLLSAFLQSLSHTSRWAVINYDGEFTPEGGAIKVKKWKIKTISPSDLEDEIALMKAVKSS